MTATSYPNNRAMTRFGLPVLVMATLAGGWAVFQTLWQGHIHASTTQIVPWGLWVAFYMFLLGLSAGAFLVSTLVFVFQVRRLEAVGPVALLSALACLVLAGLVITLDLGHPERGYKVLTHFNPSSVMSWMGLFYGAYAVVLVLMLSRVLRTARPGVRPADQQFLRSVGWVGLFLGVAVLLGEGAVFAVTKAQPNWFGGLFPIVVLVSALASGAALLTAVTAQWIIRPAAERHQAVLTLAYLAVGFLAVEGLILIADVLTAFYGGVPYEVEAWRLILFGPFWWVFWFVQLGIGMLLPFIMISRRAVREHSGRLGLMGLLVLVGMLGARLNLIIPPQIHPDFHGLSEAYHHARFAVGYFPSATEWLVALGVAALGVWLFLAARRLLPHAFGRPSHEGEAIR